MDAAIRKPADAARPLRPSDAATLILIDRSGPEPLVLLGRRSMRHAFLPGVYVFPGGRVEPGDGAMAVAGDYAPAHRERLLVDMKRGASDRRARALGLAAIRETFEEAGIMLGTVGDAAQRSVPEAWRPFRDRGVTPSLAPLRFVGRAVTPPGRPRRYDTRFFAAFADAIALRLPLDQLPDDELEDVRWVSLAEAERLELPRITTRMIGHLRDRLAADPDLAGDVPVPYYARVGGAMAFREI